ncbi:MAG: DUF4835 family protein [Bacteroidota bacterium]
MKRLLLSLCSLLCAISLTAQEINATITVNTPQLRLVDPAIFQDMKNVLENFMNNQKWTSDYFEFEERINCNIQLTITEEVSEVSFKANMQIQATRPVYGSTYETVILSHNDKDISFEYQPNQPVEYIPNGYSSNISSILSFYVYYVLGLDYDSFAPFGGEELFQTAQEIVNTIPPNVASRFKGWRSLDNNRNRFWMIENMLNPRVRPFRKALYDYHRQGLDVMHDDVVAGRAIMEQALTQVEKVNKAYPNSMVIQMFVNSKSSEIIEIYKEGNSSQKSQVRRIMSRIDAANASRYRQIGS